MIYLSVGRQWLKNDPITSQVLLRKNNYTDDEFKKRNSPTARHDQHGAGGGRGEVEKPQDERSSADLRGHVRGCGKVPRQSFSGTSRLARQVGKRGGAAEEEDEGVVGGQVGDEVLGESSKRERWARQANRHGLSVLGGPL